MIVPTPGRVVWFTPSSLLNMPAGFMMIDPSKPCSASVAYVWNDRLVNLTVSDHYGHTFHLTSVQLLQDDDARPALGYFAEWMPYQVGQAAKHAAPDLATVRGAVARGWCADANRNKEMDGDLAEAISLEVVALGRAS